MSTLYWVGNSGNWDDPSFSHWATSSGGAAGHAAPTSTDDVIFDNNSFTTTGQAVTVRNGFTNACNNIDTSLVLNLPTLQFTASSVSSTSKLNVSGNITMTTAIATNVTLATFAAAVLDILGSGTQNIDIETSLNTSLQVLYEGSGTFNLTHDLSCGPIQIELGTFTTNNHNISLVGSGTQIWEGATVNLGSSTITSNGTGAWLIGYSGSGVVTINAGTSVLYFPTGGGINMQPNGFTSHHMTLHDLHFGNGGGGKLITAFTGSTFEMNNLTIDAGTTVTFTNGTFQVSGTFSCVGTSSQKNTITGAGSNWLINSPSNTVNNVFWTNIQDSHASGVTPFIATDSFDLGNNVNWQINNPNVWALSTNLVYPPTERFALLTNMDLAEYIANIDQITYNSARVQTYTPLLSGGRTYGFVYGTSTTPIVGVDNSKDLTGNNGIAFTTLLGLALGQTYYVRMYIDTSGVYQYGATKTFTTSAVVPIGVISTDNLVSKYQFLLFDSSGNLIADLGGYVSNRTFSITRNRPEEISFSIPLFTLDQLAASLHLTPADFFQAGIQQILIRRDTVPICAGQIDYWESDFSDPANPVINVKAHGWMSLFSYRYITDEYDGDDAAFIIRDIITNTQALTNGDFGITLGTTVAGSNTYTSKIFTDKTISDILTEMSEEDGGFDFQFTWDKVFNLFLPSQGVTRNDILFTYPGNLTDLKISVDSTKLVNELLARGTGLGTDGISTTIDDLTSQGIYALRQGIKDFPDMDADQLANSAASELLYYKVPLVLNSITYNGLQNNTPIVGSYSVGDKIRVYAPTLPLYQNLNQPFTIDSITVTLDKDDVENVQLALAVPT